MDPMTVTARDGVFAGFCVAMAAFIGGIVWWTLKGKGSTDKTLLDFTMKTIGSVGDAVEKVGDNIQAQTGHMAALTESTRRIESKVDAKFDEHGRRLDEHGERLDKLEKPE